MKTLDAWSWSSRALGAHRLRSSLCVLGVAIGIAAVILLTSIGEGTRRHVLTEFTQFGTNVLTITPGKTQTSGIPGVFGGTTRKLTIEDAERVARIPGVEACTPHTHGQARVEALDRGRSVFVFGVTSDLLVLWSTRVASGAFLPRGDPRRGSDVAVLGPRLARELFGDDDPLGRRVRIAGGRFRVIGVLEAKGQMLGIDLDDAAYLPLASHMRLFNRDEVDEINVLMSQAASSDDVVERIRACLVERHGTEDFTITTQAAMLEVFGRIMDAITLAVGAIGGVSLFVGMIGILSMMWIAVGERTGEIGLMMALGARARDVHRLFLGEAALLATAGGVAGVGLGLALAAGMRAMFAGLPVHTPREFVLAALGLSFATGLFAGVLPARRAARLDPIESLRSE